MKKNENNPSENSKVIKIEYPGLDEMPEAIYANNVRVSHNENDFVLYFSTIDVPPILKGEKYEKESVKAKVVARVRLTPLIMEGLIKALQNNLETFNKRVRRGGSIK
jgi:hypothetical protein